MILNFQGLCKFSIIFRSNLDSFNGEEAKAIKIRVDNLADEYIIMSTQVKRLED